MATIKILLNGERVPFTCFAAGADVEPALYLNYEDWTNSVTAENIVNISTYTAKMTAIFNECGADTTKIVFETI